MKDRVHGVGLNYHCHIGFHAYERQIRQRIQVDFEAETDWMGASQRDESGFPGLVDYYEVNRAVGELVEGGEWCLIEALAESIARLLCQRFPVSRVRVRVTKMPFDMPNATAVAVECWRSPSDFADAGHPHPIANGPGKTG